MIGMALTMVLRRIDEDGVGPRDPSDSPAGRMRRVYNYRGCRLAEMSAAYVAAKDHFGACIEIDPRFAPAFCNRARMWIEHGDLAAARSDCDAAATFDPRYPALVVTRKLIDALQLMSKTRSGSYAEIAAEHGLLDYLRCYDRPARPGEFQGTLNDLPDPFDPPVLGKHPTASNANHLGVVLGRMGRYAEADAALTTAIRADPHFDRAYFNRGKVRFLADDSAGAIADLTTYIDRNHGDVDAYALRAQVLRKAGHEDRAAADEAAVALWSS
jgi:tetratricopeptide (TPR) repeat protein